MSYEEFQNCPYCSHYLNEYPKPSTCPSCHRPFPTTSVDLSGITSAIQAQADSAAKMLAALTYAHALPLTSLLETWWEKLSSSGKGDFAKALIERMKYLVKQGIVDDQLGPIVKSRFNNDVLVERVKKLVENGGGDDPITEAVARAVADQLGRDRERVIAEACQETIRKIARERSMDAREVIEAAVRDHMPDIEELTRRITGEIADEIAQDVRKRLRKSD